MAAPTGVAASAHPGLRRLSVRRLPERVRRILGATVLVAAVVAWALLLRPTALGGPATYVVVSGTSMEPTLHTGDLVVLRAHDSYGVGDLVTYPVPEGAPGAGDLVIHRIVGGSAEGGFTTQGDNRRQADDWHPTAEQVRGREWFTVPGAGTVLTRFTDPPLLAALAGGVAVVVVLLRSPSARRDEDAAETGAEGDADAGEAR